MTEHDQASHTGDALFEEFVEEVKQALGHLYDFAYLQQHPLARLYDGDDDLSAKTAGRQLRFELIKAIESLEPSAGAHFRAPVARLHNILHLYYIENLSIQTTAEELGLSERQAYRDLRRGQERVSAVLWDNRLPTASQHTDYSLESEVARLKLNISAVNIGDVFRKAQRAVENLAQEARVTIAVEAEAQPMTLSTDAALGHQIMVTLLSTAIQQTRPEELLHVAFRADQASVTLTLRYPAQVQADPAAAFSAVTRLAQHLRWQVTYDDPASAQTPQVSLQMTSDNATVFVIDDNEGWVELLGRFLKGFNYLLVSAARQPGLCRAGPGAEARLHRPGRHDAGARRVGSLATPADAAGYGRDADHHVHGAG